MRVNFDRAFPAAPTCMGGEGNPFSALSSLALLYAMYGREKGYSQVKGVMAGQKSPTAPAGGAFGREGEALRDRQGNAPPTPRRVVGGFLEAAIRGCATRHSPCDRAFKRRPARG